MVLRRRSLAARILIALPFKFYKVEAARVGDDYDTFVRISLCSV